MDNLISTFIEVVTEDGALLADGIREMNAALGVNYTNSRLREWERGDRQPTAQVVDYMLGVVLPVLLTQKEMKVKNPNRLIKKCRLPWCLRSNKVAQDRSE